MADNNTQCADEISPVEAASSEGAEDEDATAKFIGHACSLFDGILEGHPPSAADRDRLSSGLQSLLREFMPHIDPSEIGIPF